MGFGMNDWLSLRLNACVSWKLHLFWPERVHCSAASMFCNGQHPRGKVKPFRFQEQTSGDACEPEPKPQSLNPAWTSLGYPGIQQQIEILVSGPCGQPGLRRGCLSQAGSGRRPSSHLTWPWVLVPWVACFKAGWFMWREVISAERTGLGPGGGRESVTHTHFSPPPT